jgi:hypothetical protein
MTPCARPRPQMIPSCAVPSKVRVAISGARRLTFLLAFMVGSALSYSCQGHPLRLALGGLHRTGWQDTKTTSGHYQCRPNCRRYQPQRINGIKTIDNVNR